MNNKTTNILVFAFIVAFVSLAYHFMGKVPGIVFFRGIRWRFCVVALHYLQNSD